MNALTEKRYIFARTFYRNVRKQLRVHVTNKIPYQRVNQVSIPEMIRERQIKFTGHCIHMSTDETINRL